MKLVLLTTLTMVAFAANSLLNRWALDLGYAEVWSFAALRLASGAATLWLLVALRGTKLQWRGGWVSPAALSLYIFGFSFAYIQLDAGIGALILFGGVQFTMFGASVLRKQAIPLLKWVGSAVSLFGLAWLVVPRGGVSLDLLSAASMGAAALGWGIYTLQGAKSDDPLGNTARNFVLAAPLGLLLWAILPETMTWQGAMLAVLSGAVTSGLGYALWYRVLPQLAVTTAALSQLTVPIIAAAMGAAILAEPLTLQFYIAAGLVLGGVALGLMPSRKS